jgi:hypothetical protein
MTDDYVDARFKEITDDEGLAGLRRLGDESRWVRFAFNPWVLGTAAVLFLAGCVLVSYSLH